MNKFTLPSDLQMEEEDFAVFCMAVEHAIDEMIQGGGEIRKLAEAITEKHGFSDRHNAYFFLVCGCLAGMEEGYRIHELLNKEPETATPTDESKDCR